MQPSQPWNSLSKIFSHSTYKVTYKVYGSLYLQFFPGRAQYFNCNDKIQEKLLPNTNQWVGKDCRSTWCLVFLFFSSYLPLLSLWFWLKILKNGRDFWFDFLLSTPYLSGEREISSRVILAICLTSFWSYS